MKFSILILLLSLTQAFAESNGRSPSSEEPKKEPIVVSADKPLEKDKDICVNSEKKTLTKKDIGYNECIQENLKKK